VYPIQVQYGNLAYHRDHFDLCLRHKQAVERVTMMKRHGRQNGRVSRFNGEDLEPVASDALRDERL
jgi:hypothetical protein